MDAEEILSLAPEPDLIQQMPRLFAADMAGAVGETGRHQRVVLLFDTHEAFFGEAIADPAALVHADFLMRDEWLRGLLGHLPLDAGVVAVVAGRTRPAWAHAPVAESLSTVISTNWLSSLTSRVLSCFTGGSL